MSVLRAASRAIKARQQVRELCERLQSVRAKDVVHKEIMDSCQKLSEMIAEIVTDLEGSLVPDHSTVAVSFFPFRNAGGRGAQEQIQRGDIDGADDDLDDFNSGTMILPSNPTGLQ